MLAVAQMSSSLSRDDRYRRSFYDIVLETDHLYIEYDYIEYDPK
jgi:hypothetical protein